MVFRYTVTSVCAYCLCSRMRSLNPKPLARMHASPTSRDSVCAYALTSVCAFCPCLCSRSRAEYTFTTLFTTVSLQSYQISSLKDKSMLAYMFGMTLERNPLQVHAAVD